MQRVCWGNPSNANVFKKKPGAVLVFVITGVEGTDRLPRPCTGVFPGLLGQRISVTHQRQTGHGTRNAKDVHGPLSHSGHFVPRYQSSFVLPVLLRPLVFHCEVEGGKTKLFQSVGTIWPPCK